MLLSLGKDSPQQPQPVLPLDLARKQLVSDSTLVDDGDTITCGGMWNKSQFFGLCGCIVGIHVHVHGK